MDIETRVDTDVAFHRWRHLIGKGMKFDAELAMFLLNWYANSVNANVGYVAIAKTYICLI